MVSHIARSSLIKESDPSDQLRLPFDTNEEGIPPFRLFEPLSSLNLTPFAAKAIRSIGASTIGDAALFVFDPTKECRGLGQGHLEEIRRKIEEFVGPPPYSREYSFDIASLLRLSLSTLEPSERAFVVTFFRLQQAVFVTPQEMREAEVMLLKDKDRKFKGIIEKAAVKSGNRTRELLDLVFCGLLRPWMVRRGGLAHEHEIHQFFFEHSRLPYYEKHPPSSTLLPNPQKRDSTPLGFDLFERCLHLLTLLTGLGFLFSEHLCHVIGKVWAISEQEKAQAQAILDDAMMLFRNRNADTSLQDLAAAVKQCRFGQWDTCPASLIRGFLFWHYLEE